VYEQGRLGAQLGGTRTWKTDNFSFRLGVQATSLGEREEVAVTLRNALGTVTRTQNEFDQNQVDELTVTGAANWTLTPRDTLNANFRVLPAPVHDQCGCACSCQHWADRAIASTIRKRTSDVDLGGD